jgi:hypothetical protein
LSTTLSKILLPVSQQGTTVACRVAAFGLAKRFDARLEVLHLCAAAWQRLPYPTELSPFYSQELVDIGREQVLLEQSEAKGWFEQAIRIHSGAAARFETIEGFLTPTMASEARVADISVVPSIGARDDVFWEAVRDAALFQSGRPVLVVPYETPSQFGKTVVVAWKDGVEAVRAVVAAAPFFAKAGHVILLFGRREQTGRPVSRGDG